MNLFILFYFLTELFLINGERAKLNACCGVNEVVIRNVCKPYIKPLNYTNLIIYDEDFYPTNKSIEQDFSFNSTSALNEEMINFRVLNIPASILKEYLVENGFLYHENLNMYNRFVKIDSFCIGHYLLNDEPIAGFWIAITQVEDTSQDHRLTIPAMYLSSFFFMLVLIVYALLPELRNLHGMILMAYVGSMMTAFIVFGTFQLLSNIDMLTDVGCIEWTCYTYYLFMASFSWMTIMSFDIWWTFRGYAKARPIHRRGELFKFIVYCAYAFGVPLLMTLGLYFINGADLTHIPWFVQPKLVVNGCFLEGEARILYLYVPMLIMLFVNWVLFLMTAFNIWRLNRATAMLRTVGNRAHRSQQQRFGLYLKLSVVMGINWVLEVLSLISPESVIWKITDTYNLLSGLLIFIIFICKRKIFIMIKKRICRGSNNYTVNWRSSQRSGRSTLSNTSDSTNETTLEVSHNPKGFQ